MRTLWPVTIILDKFEGKYCDGKWIAYNDNERPDMWKSEKDQQEYFFVYNSVKNTVNEWKNCMDEKLLFAFGRTPAEAFSNLIHVMSYHNLVKSKQ